MGLCFVSALLGAIAAGCGPITTGMIVKKGGMWLAKEAFKKGVEELREDDDGHGGERDEMSRERRQDKSRHRKHRGDHD
jgi:hypothetical protein